jgi:formate-dependent nitrite reductase membrane component NrfD
MTEELQRARLPLEIYPISAGVKGGLAGSVAMAVLAMLYGIISGHGIWYPINLLSAGFFPTRTTMAQIAAFHWDALIIASILHLICSLLVGLLYGAALPMFPRRPVLLGGVIAPVLWSGLIHSILDALDPVLNQRIDWLWFVISQIGFGIVAGIIVSRQVRVRTWQYLPFAVRAGIEAPGAIDRKKRDSDR